MHSPENLSSRLRNITKRELLPYLGTYFGMTILALSSREFLLKLHSSFIKSPIDTSSRIQSDLQVINRGLSDTPVELATMAIGSFFILKDKTTRREFIKLPLIAATISSGAATTLISSSHNQP